MFVLMKAPIASLLFVIYMMVFYYRKPHIPIKSTRIFKHLTVAVLFTDVFDLITIYTVNHREVVFDQVNLIVHIIYLMSILCFIYLLFLYLRSYLETNLGFSDWVRRCHSLPFIVSTVGIFVLPITYVQGKETYYSLGPKAYALYGSVVIYLMLILYYCLRYWEILDREKRIAIILAVPLGVTAAVLQMMIPETLVVNICATVILLGLILSNENTEKYVDEKTGLFNQSSFEKVLEELLFHNQKVILNVLCVCKTGDNLDWNHNDVILQDIYREIKQYRMYGYRISENGVVLVSTFEGKVQSMAEKAKNYIENKYGPENVCIETKIFAGKNTATKHKCMRNIISFCTETGSRFAYIDYLTNIYNRNALERDLDKAQEDGSIYYFMADLNDLKIVNDTLGHSAGDQLLQGFARMLVDAAGEDGRAYRQGGDEFVILYGQDAQQFVRALDKRCRSYNQSCSVPISYAIGYSMINKDNFRDIADSMMYADKQRVKKQERHGHKNDIT